MPRGGYREGAGAKSTWQTEGGTKTIRVPEELAEKILDYARQLDEGEIDEDNDQEDDAVQRVLDLIERLKQGLERDGENELDLDSRDKAAGRRVLSALYSYLQDNGLD